VKNKSVKKRRRSDYKHREQQKNKVKSGKQTEAPRISVCMIVKNEEKSLDNCLKSIKDIADEIIIVDTGSTDRTVEAAKRYTDKIYFHPWEDSFSKARNQVLAYAACDWIFQIDADEVLAPSCHRGTPPVQPHPDDRGIIHRTEGH
jgi:cellulose synthase/poly-beta-1,6-N-acetylglucosamine synthase-like glycosyltransferase